MKKYSLKFWIIFWISAAIFLTGWFCFWQIYYGQSANILKIVAQIPVGSEKKSEYIGAANLAEIFLKKDNKERNYLILFHNNMELRPGGGFIGAFGIVKIKNGHVLSVDTNDLSNFDELIPDGTKPPYPMREIGYVDSWKLRDSNWSPDFSTNARKAEEFYRLGGGKEDFTGIVGITSNVLTSLLKVVGPVRIEGYPGEYDSENAVLMLEYQVEKSFDEQGIEQSERKSIMGELAGVILKRTQELNLIEKKRLAEILLEDLRKKDIQLYFADENLQRSVENANWTGKVRSDWKKDYLMTIDANLGSYKSDYYVERALDYTIDLSGDVPKANLKITYKHTAKQRDWMTKDYLSYLRVYVPEEAWLVDSKNFDGTKFENELGRKYFGAIIKVPLDATKTIELNYILPKEIAQDYDLLIQKQAGLSEVPVVVHVIYTDGTKNGFSKNMESDLIYGEVIRK